jgi:hypothetical protein
MLAVCSIAARTHVELVLVDEIYNGSPVSTSTR